MAGCKCRTDDGDGESDNGGRIRDGSSCKLQKLVTYGKPSLYGLFAMQDARKIVFCNIALQ